jgi:hypothetical protein
MRPGEARLVLAIVLKVEEEDPQGTLLNESRRKKKRRKLESLRLTWSLIF